MILIVSRLLKLHALPGHGFVLEMKIEIESRICFVRQSGVGFVGDAGRLSLDVLLGVPGGGGGGAGDDVGVVPGDPHPSVGVLPVCPGVV